MTDKVWVDRDLSTWCRGIGGTTIGVEERYQEKVDGETRRWMKMKPGQSVCVLEDDFDEGDVFDPTADDHIFLNEREGRVTVSMDSTNGEFQEELVLTPRTDYDGELKLGSHTKSGAYEGSLRDREHVGRRMD